MSLTCYVCGNYCSNHLNCSRSNCPDWHDLIKKEDKDMPEDRLQVSPGKFRPHPGAQSTFIKSDLVKETNPKDAVGTGKVPMSTVPLPVIAELCVAMLEGSRKYGRHNYRIAGVRASVYFDAVCRHMFAWFEGEDLDPDSGLSHVTKAIASLVVLRDSMIRDNWVDDRPPKTADGWLKELNRISAELIEKYPDAVDAYLEGDQHEQKS